MFMYGKSESNKSFDALFAFMNIYMKISHNSMLLFSAIFSYVLHCYYIK